MNDVVVVACKLPHGLRMRLFKMTPVQEASPGGTITVKRAEAYGASLVVKGYLQPNTGALVSPSALASWAFTENVDKDFMAEWLKQNQGHDAVTSGLIFCAATMAEAQAEARSRAKIKGGSEPLDPANLPRGIETANPKAA
jgi:hypothetical protein